MGRRVGRWLTVCLAVAVLWSFVSGTARAQEALDVPPEQIERIVREYLLREPEVIYEALQELQRRQAEASAARQKQALVEHRGELYDRSDDPIAGNPDGNVTLVEFFDYRCTYCRRVVGSIQELMEDDRELRLVLKDLPVLGPDSVRAARAALASHRQGGYVPFHFALMASTDLSMGGIRATAASVGLDPDRLEEDMNAPEIQATIDENYRLASALGIEGTPAFVIGDELVPGAVSLEHLVELIDEARSECLTC
jgi:protein-disulfide isomerase